MKILYGIQGTGNGHLSRALQVVPALQDYGHVDILISGLHSELKLPFDTKHNLKGLGFVFGKKGGIDLVETYKKNRIKRFQKEVKNLDVEPYDLVISDFEPITSWACQKANKMCVGLSNQASLIHPAVPKAKSNDVVGKFILRNYAPCTRSVALSYEAYAQDVFTPIIRENLRHKICTDQGHYTVYLPSFNDNKIYDVLSQIKHVQWDVFSKYTNIDYEVGNVRFNKLEVNKFEKSITTSSGIVTAAGFGTTSEALYMGKKLLVIPQKNQYEQSCNAEALKQMGVTVIKALKSKHVEKIKEWIKSSEPIKKDYRDNVGQIVQRLISIASDPYDAYEDYLTSAQYAIQTA